MIPALQQSKRRIVPRWRESTIAAITGELAPLQYRAFERGRTNEELASLIEDWNENRSIPFASDLLAGALILESYSEESITDAVDYILSLGENAPSLVRSLAEYIQSGDVANGIIDSGSDLSEEKLASDSREMIRRKKSMLRRQPRNSLASVDMSRYYAMLGQDGKAVASMQRGLALAPNNRFVLRSAVRLYVHTLDLDIGYDLLRKSPATRVDPWLRAAEIAIADLMEQVPSRLGHTRRLLRDGSIAPHHVSELASAVATFDLYAGSVRSARRLFNLSLREPTENAVAQSNWARRYMSGISNSPDHLFLPRTYEARTLDSLQRLDLKECFNACLSWLEDEPFSLGPVAIGMFIAMVAFEDHQIAIKLAKWGLMSHPDHFLLRNNLTIAYAESDRMEEARDEYDGIDPDNLSSYERVYWLATRGLLAFRGRCYEKGRHLYKRALQEAIDQSDVVSEALALAFWACEELRLGEMEEVERIGHRLDELVNRISDPEVRIALAKLDRLKSEGSRGKDLISMREEKGRSYKF